MSQTEENTTKTLGVVSYLNSQPLIEGLGDNTSICLSYAVPACLPAMLRTECVDVALVPVVDFAREAGTWTRVSDACIASNGETLTVRVFSRVRPEEVTVLHADEHSHTSVALAQLIWHHCYGRQLTLETINAAGDLADCESILLIGDKVVTAPSHDFEYDIDLGSAWKQWTGLPFVFAVWAGPDDRNHDHLAQLLSEARDRGVDRASQIAAEMGPKLGWPIELAQEYLTRRLQYTLTPPARKGMRRFIKLATDYGIIAGAGEMVR